MRRNCHKWAYLATLFIAGCKATPETASQIQVKGFYLGMPSTEFKAVVTTKYPDVFRKCESEKKGAYSCNGGTFEFDSAKTLQEFSFGPGIVNQLFKVADMPAGDFAQQFIDSYGIPELKFKEVPAIIEGLNFGTVRYWEYRSPNGFLLAIGEDKSVIVKRIPSESEREFD